MLLAVAGALTGGEMFRHGGTLWLLQGWRGSTHTFAGKSCRRTFHPPTNRTLDGKLALGLAPT